jgi:uncharacterized protein (UPF0332 family)
MVDWSNAVFELGAMPTRLTRPNLLLLSKSTIAVLGNFQTGAYLHTTSGKSIDELMEQACKDRYALAKQILRHARMEIESQSPRYRIVLARSYYSMYHSARAVVYLVKRGDDHESHSILPRHIPDDFPARDQWENDLKTARLERNKADYDPYPLSDKAYKQSAEIVYQSAKTFLPVVRAYLGRKGCLV